MRTTTTASLILLYMIALGGNKSLFRFLGTARGFASTTSTAGSRDRLGWSRTVPPFPLGGRAKSSTADLSSSFQGAALRGGTRQNRRHLVTLPSSTSSRQNQALRVMQDSTSTAATETAPSTAPSPAQKVMSDDDRYLFDLNGFLVVRGVLTPEEVQRANDAIDRHQHEMVERLDAQLRNAKSGTYFFGTGSGRKDLGRMLEWTAGDATVFRSILAHEKLVPIFHDLLGQGYRMDHLPLVIAQDCGAEGFQLHGGTVDCHTGEYNHHLAYNCVHGTIRTHLLGCNVMLTDHNAGDGGFCVVPGSHKSNFRMPSGMVDGEKFREFVVQPETKAGDVVLFSEGTVHGAMAWTPQNRQRRACLYRFAPATMAYGRSYFAEAATTNGESGGSSSTTARWPAAMYEGRLTDAQRAVLEPPYATRLDRPLIVDASRGAVQVSSRTERKKRHDAQVFGTPYF